MQFNELNKDNYIIFAIKHYDNPNCVTKEEFFDDMNKFKHVKKLFNLYQKSGVLKTHLILNHIITLYNLFGDAATPLLLFKVGCDNWSALKTFMIYLNRYPEITSSLDNIKIDEICFKELRLI
jgi:hypothetical protein